MFAMGPTASQVLLAIGSKLSYFDFERIDTITEALRKCETAARAMLEQTDETDPLKCVICSQLATILALQAITSELNSFAYSLRRIGV